jgi:excisionase family DNA binding protein
MLSTSKVAAQLGVTRQTVHNWISAGKLKAVKVGGVWRVTQEDVIAFQKSNTPAASTDKSGGDSSHRS